MEARFARRLLDDDQPALHRRRPVQLLVKQGLLDGPEGWMFALLSGLSEWVLARREAALWREACVPSTNDSTRLVQAPPAHFRSAATSRRDPAAVAMATACAEVERTSTETRAPFPTATSPHSNERS